MKLGHGLISMLLMTGFGTVVALANDHAPAHPESATYHEEKVHDSSHAPAEHGKAHTAAHRPAPVHEPSIFEVLWKNFIAKVDQMRALDEDNESLRKKVAWLESENARLAIDSLECREGYRAHKLKTEARHEGGLERARTIASLKAADPKLLARPPKAVFEEAAKAFAQHDFETAATAYVFLAENTENDVYRTAQTFYLAGVSLYKMGNIKKAAHFLSQSLEHATGRNTTYGPRALSWLAVCHKALGDKSGEQKFLHELIQRYPKSKEAFRVNQGGHGHGT